MERDSAARQSLLGDTADNVWYVKLQTLVAARQNKHCLLRDKADIACCDEQEACLLRDKKESDRFL